MPHFRLFTLGRIELIDDRGQIHDLGNRRRKLVLLAVLGTASRPLKRDALVDMFWGEEDELRARHSLSDALSHLRRVLGRDSILSRKSEVALTPAAGLAVDAVEVIDAAARGAHAEVVELYTGPFLDGVYVPDSRPFEDWVTQERLRLDRLFKAASAAQCAALAGQHRWSDCVSVGTRWLDADPTSGDAALHIMKGLTALGTPEATRRALDVYQSFASRLRSEFDSVPDARLTGLANEIITTKAAEPTPSIDVLQSGTTHQAPDAGARLQEPEGKRAGRGVRRGLVAAAASIVLVAMAMRARVSIGRAAESEKQVVAIVDTRASIGDSALGWLGQGFAQMVAADLDRGRRVEVVAPSRVRALLARRGTSSTPMDDAEAIDVAKRLGARWAVRALLRRKDSTYEVQLRVRDATDGAERVFTVGGSNILNVADETSARIRGVTEASEAGPHFADVETGNVAALEHFVRANQASEEGRYAVAVRELDAAIAADSGFASAIVFRLRLALETQDLPVIASLSHAYERAAPRLTRWDALEQAAYLALHSGEHARAEALGRELVAAYPHDPRAYEMLANILAGHGRWAAADSVLERALALDSLAIAAGRGPCAPCAAYSGEIGNHVQLGDLAGAERLARRWLLVQPELPAAWSSLATVLAGSGQFDEAILAEQRAAQLSEDDPEYPMRVGRILVMARRLDAADSLVRHWLAAAGTSVEYRVDALDLQAVVERERGQHRASEVTLRRIRDEYHDGGLILIHANALARTGKFAAARDEYESMPHDVNHGSAGPMESLAGDRARAFAWHHALEADALRLTADTAWLGALADSIERIGARSYYVRDWGLHHHVRGLIALRAGQPAQAAREFEVAKFTVAAWTRTNAELARARSMLGDYTGALRVLRDAYQAPPDAMGRYLTRTEIDYWMARTFVAARMPDSARVYGRYVAAAWAHADPEVREIRDGLLASIH